MDIDEFLKKELEDESVIKNKNTDSDKLKDDEVAITDNKKTEENVSSNEDFIVDENSVFVNEALKKSSKKVKSENDLKKEKAFNFIKIAGVVFVILIIIFVATLIVKTFIKQNSLDDRRTIKDEFKNVKIDNNPTDFWKKKMEIELIDQREGQNNFKTDINNTLNTNNKLINKKIDEFVINVDNQIKESDKGIVEKLNTVNLSLSNLNEKLEQTEQSTLSKIEKVKSEIKKENLNSNLNISLPPIKQIFPPNIPIISEVVVYEEEEYYNSNIKEEENKEKEKQKEEDEKSLEVLLPSGFVQVITYTGIKGPTGSKGSSEVYPVRMEIMGNLIAANGDEIDVDGCYLRGAAKGDITTIRNHVSLTRFYCTGEDEKGKYLIEEKISGQVHDELDGSLGFPGVLVDSAGKLLSRELSLAVVQGIADMANSTENIIVPDTGVFSASDTNYGQEFAGGAGSGFSKGLEGIMEYWRDILKGYYPFIDSKAARVGKAFIEFENKKLKKNYYDDLVLDKNKKSSNWQTILK